MKLRIEDLPMDIINHYRCERREIFMAEKKGSSVIVVKTRTTKQDPEPLRTVWRRNGNDWEIQELKANTFELPAPIGSKPESRPGTLWGQPITRKEKPCRRQNQGS